MLMRKGFTLVELLISMTVTLMIFAIVSTIFLQLRKVSLRHDMAVAMMQQARIGADEMARLIRMTGYHIDREQGQVALIEAAPFQIIFNADTDPDHNACPRNRTIPLSESRTAYSPSVEYRTDAETIRFTLDSTDDGFIDISDMKDNREEEGMTPNPNDMVLMKEINGGNDRQLALGMLGPFDANDAKTGIVPMFQYWAATSPCTMILLGDANCDGELRGKERYFRAMTAQAVLRNVRRVRISVTTTAERVDPFDKTTYHTLTLSSEVSLRNAGESFDAAHDKFFTPDPNEYSECTFHPADCGGLP